MTKIRLGRNEICCAEDSHNYISNLVIVIVRVRVKVTVIVLDNVHNLHCSDKGGVVTPFTNNYVSNNVTRVRCGAVTKLHEISLGDTIRSQSFMLIS